MLRVGDYLDVIDAVWQVRNVEGLPSEGLEVGVTPANRHLLLNPQGAGEAALAAESDELWLPERVPQQQVDAIGRRNAEAHLPAPQHKTLVAVEQPVLGELLEVPVVMALLVVEAHRAGRDPADDVVTAPEVLIGRHRGRVLLTKSLDVESSIAEIGYRRAEVDTGDSRAPDVLNADSPGGQRLQVG